MFGVSIAHRAEKANASGALSANMRHRRDHYVDPRARRPSTTGTVRYGITGPDPPSSRCTPRQSNELRSEDVRSCSDPTDPNSTALFGSRGQTTLVNAPDIRLALDTEQRVAPNLTGATHPLTKISDRPTKLRGSKLTDHVVV